MGDTTKKRSTEDQDAPGGCLETKERGKATRCNTEWRLSGPAVPSCSSCPVPPNTQPRWEKSSLTRSRDNKHNMPQHGSTVGAALCDGTMA